MQLEELSLGRAKTSPLLPREDFLIVPCCSCSTLHQPTFRGWAAAHTSVFHAQPSPSQAAGSWIWLLRVEIWPHSMVWGVNLVLSFSSCFSHQESKTAVSFSVCVTPTTSWVTNAPLPSLHHRNQRVSGVTLRPWGNQTGCCENSTTQEDWFVAKPQDGCGEQMDVSWPCIKHPEIWLFLADQISLRNSGAHPISHKEPQQLSRMHLQEKEGKWSSLNIDMPSLRQAQIAPLKPCCMGITAVNQDSLYWVVTKEL